MRQRMVPDGARRAHRLGRYAVRRHFRDAGHYQRNRHYQRNHQCPGNCRCICQPGPVTPRGANRQPSGCAGGAAPPCRQHRRCAQSGADAAAEIRARDDRRRQAVSSSASTPPTCRIPCASAGGDRLRRRRGAMGHAAGPARAQCRSCRNRRHSPHCLSRPSSRPVPWCLVPGGMARPRGLGECNLPALTAHLR